MEEGWVYFVINKNIKSIFVIEIMCGILIGLTNFFETFFFRLMNKMHGSVQHTHANMLSYLPLYI